MELIVSLAVGCLASASLGAPCRHLQAGALCDQICKTKATRKQVTMYLEWRQLLLTPSILPLSAQSGLGTERPLIQNITAAPQLVMLFLGHYPIAQEVILQIVVIRRYCHRIHKIQDWYHIYRECVRQPR